MATPERIDQLQRELAGHIGEFVLALWTRYSILHGTGGCFGTPDHTVRNIDRKLGVIGPQAKSFVFDERTNTLPTVRHYSEQERAWHTNVEQGEMKPAGWFSPVETFLDSPYTGSARESTEMILFGSEPQEDDVWLQIIVGDEAVAAWFGWNGIAEELDFPEKDPLWFQSAAEKLGRPLENAPELEAQKEERRKQLLEELWVPFFAIYNLQKEIAAIVRTPAKSGVLARGGAVTLVEDADDAKVVAMGPRRDLAEAKSRLEKMLQEADSLGISDHPYVAACRMRLESLT